jgi:hypothetical protein
MKLVKSWRFGRVDREMALASRQVRAAPKPLGVVHGCSNPQRSKETVGK